MLKREDIEDLIHLRLSKEKATALLLRLSTDKIDVRTIGLFLEVMRQSVQGSCDSFLRCGSSALDCCGTGGSGITNKYNVSTAATFVLAAGGVKVSKFGNRSSRGACGSFDLLEALGFPLEVPAASQVEIFEQTGLALLFAPQFYPQLSALADVRKAAGIKTIFNFTGPLLNPISPAYRVLGVSDPSMQVLLASVISREPSHKRTLLVRGEGNMDEITPHGTNQLYDINNGKVDSFKFVAEASAPAAVEEAVETGGDACQTAKQFYALIAGEQQLPAYRRQVCLNAGAGFYIMEKAPSIEAGANLAAELLAGGEALRKFEQCRRAYAGIFA